GPGWFGGWGGRRWRVRRAGGRAEGGGCWVRGRATRRVYRRSLHDALPISEIERLVLSVAISTATWGCGRIAAYLTRSWRLNVAPSTVQRVLRRAGLATRRARLTVLEHQAARTAGLLTERTRQRLWRARYGRTRHVEATEPGELVCLDTFYIGNLKGVGKVWQITACDAASSYGVAALLPTHTAADAAAFLRDVLGRSEEHTSELQSPDHLVR